MMTLSNVAVLPTDRNMALLSSLAANFSDTPFPARYCTADGPIDYQKLHTDFYSPTHGHLFANFQSILDLPTLTDLINSIDSEKDAGPQSITIDFNKYNYELLQEHLLQILNTILVDGIAPESFKLSHTKKRQIYRNDKLSWNCNPIRNP